MAWYAGAGRATAPHVKATEDLINPTSPGFRVTTVICRCYIWTKNPIAILTRFLCPFGWFVPCRKRMVTQSVSSTERVVKELWFSSDWLFSRGLYPGFWGAAVVEVGRNLGYTQGDKKHPPTECLHFTCGQLQRLTGNYSPQNWGKLLMGRVRALRTPDGSRRQPETTHEVFSWSRSWKPAAQNVRDMAVVSTGCCSVIWLDSLNVRTVSSKESSCADVGKFCMVRALAREVDRSKHRSVW